MVLRYMQNSGHGAPHMTTFMTILGFYVSPPIPNIKKVEAYEVYKSREVYHFFFLIKFPVECARNPDWRPIFDPSYDHIYKCDHFG